ncbi:MAG: trypsin-like serine protease [Myxococcota bacterium]
MLQTGQVTTIGRSECAALAPGNVTNRMICTLDDDSTVQGSCNGDSGGPLYREDGKQIGLVSWGVLGCDVDSPSVYASVANLRRWITRNTGI